MYFFIFFCFIGICCAYLSRVHTKKVADKLDEQKKQARIKQIESLLRCDRYWSKLILDPTLIAVITNNRLVREYEELTGKKKTESYGLSFESLEDCHISLEEKFAAGSLNRKVLTKLNSIKDLLERKYRHV